jgi:hypothetical protein
MIKKNIALPKGGTLEVNITPQFLEVVRKHFELSATSFVNDDHIRMYIWGAFKNAVEKAEKSGDVYSSA